MIGFVLYNLLLKADKIKCTKFTLPNVTRVEGRIKIEGNLVDLVDNTTFVGVTLDCKYTKGSLALKN